MKRYAVLPGYGLFDESKTDYKKYLDRFVKLVASKKIDEVVLCGGHTSAVIPDKSEAETMVGYLRPRLGSDVKINLADRPLSTTQNLRFAKQFIDLNPVNKIFVVSDAVRFPKVMWIVLKEWFGLDKQQVADYWISMSDKVYSDPEHRHKPVLLKDIRKQLKYGNVAIIVDRIHNKYKEAVHVLLTEPLEIEALYDSELDAKFNDYTLRKFRLKR